MAVFVGVYCVAAISGAQLNPAVTIGLALAGKFGWGQVPLYILSQMVGAALGAFLVWLQYRQHFDITEDRNLKLAVFCTAPQIRSYFYNFVSEAIGTFVLVFGVLCLAAPEAGLGSLDALPVSLLVFAIGLSLGGTTGYAINPARDFAPRLMHAILPIKDKRDSDWSYSWIPILGPICGAAVAAVSYRFLR